MSAESPHLGSERELRQEEFDLLSAMLKHSRINSAQERLKHARVRDMFDGGMGSIRFSSKPEAGRRLGIKLGEAEYVDEDGVLVSLVLSADQTGELFELDSWKVDFSPLKKYPRPGDLKFENLSFK